ncbi:amidase [Gulosibacter sp. 10]|uniref:amidase n=1 Tax=Gulosibacter sp. 10 TaxID=1255570 RepID=UPI00097F103E|nr:amidase [Gulosibacter sp. 10]SJM57595.1 Aspartyl-tRNA(Asn) amidotransferase subunit A amidotransferase subunit A [Gulosibacter sp. 10]
MSELHELSAVEQRRLLAEGELRSLELVEHYLARIEERNDSLRAFTTVTGEAALERARRLDEARQEDPRAARDLRAFPLWGLPFGDKDLSDRAGVPTSFGSRSMTGYVPERSSPIVEDMDAAGGVSLGKTNTPEFGFPSYTENRLDGGVARNPWDLERGPGGSSGGAAVAAAARMLPFAPGSDGGGSIRIPAAACGLVGLKPGRGRVPGGSGIDALGGLGVAGPIARTVEDAALLLDGMIAKRGDGSPHDRFALTAPAGEASYLEALERPLERLRIGFNTWSPWASHYDIRLDPAAQAVLERAAAACERLGHRVEPVEPRPFPEYVDAFRAIWQGGASGVPLDDEALAHVQPLTRWLIEVGRTLPASRVVGALGALQRFEQQLIADYAPYDLVLTPSLAMSPRPLWWYDQEDGDRNFVEQCQYTPYTSYLNVAGLPAITLPVEADPLPWGVQAIGRPGAESLLLRFGAELERVYDWAARAPEPA